MNYLFFYSAELFRALRSNKNVVNLELNYRIIVFLFIIVFGIYGWGTYETSQSIFTGKDLLITSTLLLSLFSTHFYRHFIDSCLPNVTISWSRLRTFFIVLIIAAIFNFSRLNDPLSGDELYYASQSQIFSFQMILKFRTYLPNFILDGNSNNVMHILSLAVLLSMILSAIYLKRIKSDFHFISIAVLLLLVLRQIVQEINSNSGQLSPLPSFWYFTTSSILGFDALVYRLSSLVPFVMLSLVILDFSRENSIFKKFSLGLTASLLLSIPLISFMSVTVEPASMTFIIVVSTFFYLIKQNFVVSGQLLILIGIAFYLRMNIIFLFVALSATYLFQNRQKSFPIKVILAPVMILLPGVVFTMISRAATRLDSSNPTLVSTVSNLRSTYQTLELSSSLFYLGMSLFCVALMLVLKASRLFMIFYSVLATVLFIVFQFPALSSIVKYPTEYLYPLVIAVSLLAIHLVANYNKSCFLVIVLFLGSLNAYGLNMRSEVIKDYGDAAQQDSTKDALGSRLIPNIPYQNEKIFRIVKDLGEIRCLNAGVVYGVFPEVQSGFSVSQVISSYELRENFIYKQALLTEDWRGVSPRALEDSGVTCVILGDIIDQFNTVKSLQEGGWLVVTSSLDEVYGTFVHLMIKSVPDSQS